MEKGFLLIGVLFSLIIFSSGCVSEATDFIMSGPGNLEYDVSEIKQRNSAGCLISRETNPVDCPENKEPCNLPDIGCKDGYYCDLDRKCVKE